MKKITYLLILFPFFANLSGEEYTGATSAFQGPSHHREPQLTINNHPLAKINGKVLSLIDVVKKMDLFLYEYDPNMKLSVAERAQFYSSRWNETLEELICNELMLLDAEQKKIEVSDGEVREELENRVG